MGGVRHARADRTRGLEAVSRLLRATRVQGGRRPPPKRGRGACLTLSDALASLYGNPPTAEAPARPPQPDHDSFLSRLGACAISLGNSSGKAHSRSNAARTLSNADQRKRVRTARADDVGREDASSSVSDATAGEAQDTGAPPIARDEPGQ